MQDPKLELVQRFFSGTGESYDFMVNFATLGIDRLWKRKIVDLIPPYSASPPSRSQTAIRIAMWWESSCAMSI